MKNYVYFILFLGLVGYSGYQGCKKSYNSGYEYGCEKAMIHIYEELNIKKIDLVSLYNFCEEIRK